MHLCLGGRKFFLVATLVAFTGGGYAPAKVQAGCGDGVGSLHAMKSSNPWANLGVSSKATKSILPTREKHKPCDGPACQRGSVPLIPTVPPVPPSVEDWSCLPIVMAPLQPTPGTGFAESPSDFPAQLPRDIFHPPRVSSPTRHV
jgi:hypothetical protein